MGANRCDCRRLNALLATKTMVTIKLWRGDGSGSDFVQIQTIRDAVDPVTGQGETLTEALDDLESQSDG